jgi:hypothetical protein
MHGAAELRKRRRANAEKIARYRRRKRNGKAVYSVEVARDEIVRVLCFRGLPAKPTKKMVEEQLSLLLGEIAARWRERWPLL